MGSDAFKDALNVPIYMRNGYTYVLEIDHLFNEATALISKSNEKKEQLQVLEERLQITNNVTRQQIIREGKSLAVRRNLQANMEMLYLSIKKRLQSSASRCYTYK